MATSRALWLRNLCKAPEWGRNGIVHRINCDSVYTFAVLYFISVLLALSFLYAHSMSLSGEQSTVCFKRPSSAYCSHKNNLCMCPRIYYVVWPAISASTTASIAASSMLKHAMFTSYPLMLEWNSNSGGVSGQTAPVQPSTPYENSTRCGAQEFINAEG